MSPALLAAYATMLPRLEAEEDLRLVVATAAGTGALAEQTSRTYWRDLLRQTGASEPAMPASKADLSAMGIAVEEVPPGE